MPIYQQGGTARAVAMGSSYVSVADDSSALLWNPAGLAKLSYIEVGLHHNSGLGDTVQEAFLFGTPLGRLAGIGVLVNAVSYGVFDERDEQGGITGMNSADSLGVCIGAGSCVAPGLYAGGSIKMVRQTLAGTFYENFAIDGGMLWSVSKGFSLGVTYSNLSVNKDRALISSGLRAGASYKFDAAGPNSILAAVAAELQPGGALSVNAGLEDNFAGVIALRTGYSADRYIGEYDGIAGLTAGLGITIQDLRIDYACAVFGRLGVSNRISLTYQFRKPPDAMRQKTGSAENSAGTAEKYYIPKPAALKNVIFEDVHFEFDSSELDEDAVRVATRNMTILKEYPGIRVLIEGHACKFGSEAYNSQLSLRRAQAIRDFMVKGGIPADRVQVIGYGARRPLTYEYIPEEINSEAARTNRRGVFDILVDK